MAKLYLKGINQPFTIEKETAVNINKILDNDSISNTQVFNKNGIRFSKSDIRYVIEHDLDDDKSASTESRQRENDDKINQYLRDFNNEITAYVKGSQELKMSFNFKVAGMYCFAIDGGDIEQYRSELTEIFKRELQTEKLIVNPTKYLKVFKVNNVITSDGLVNVDYIVRKAPFKMMENYLSRVYNTISYLKL